MNLHRWPLSSSDTAARNLVRFHQFRIIRTHFLSGSGSGHSASPRCQFGTNIIVPNRPSGRYRLCNQSVWQATWPLRALGALSFLASGSGLPFGACPAALHGRACPRIRRTQKDTGTHRAQPLAELSLTERSEVLRPSEARCSVASEASPLCRAGGAELN